MTKLVVETDELYDTEQAAQLIGIGIATVWRWIRDKKLVALKIDRRTLIPKSEIERLSRRTPGNSIKGG